MKNIKNSLVIVIAILCCSAASAVELLGHRWYLGILNQEALVMTDFKDQKPYLQFETNNTFTAYVGCNNISGTYSLVPPNGLEMSANNPSADNPSCAANFATLEGNFITLLRDIKVWEITNDVLYLKANSNDIISIAIFMPDKPY